MGFSASLDSIKGELKSLKELCDSELLNEEECKTQKARILATLDSKQDDEIWFCNYGGEHELGLKWLH